TRARGSSPAQARRRSRRRCRYRKPAAPAPQLPPGSPPGPPREPTPTASSSSATLTSIPDRLDLGSERLLQGLAELLAARRSADDGQVGDGAVAADPDGLGAGMRRILRGHAAVAIKGDGQLELVPLEHGRDLLLGLLQVDRDKLHALVAELPRH